MMELFRMEAETQAAVLSNGLLELEADPNNLQRIEELMRAAHSLKGAARIVDLHSIVQLTHAMEDHLVGIQEGKHTATSSTADVLFECLDFLKEVAEWTDAQAQDKATESQATVESLIQKIQGLADPQAASAAPASASPSQQPAKKPAAPAPSAGDLQDSSMMELFRMEAETQAAVLSNGLLELEADPNNLQRIEELMRAAHSLKGAARIVDLHSIVQLTHAMEDHLVGIQEGKHTATSSTADVLFECLDFLKEVAEWTDAQAQDKATESQATVESLIQKIQGLADPQAASAAPASASPSQQPAKKPAAPASSEPAKTKKPPASSHKSPKPAAKSSGARHGASEFVRVAAKNLNHMVDLAAECLVESHNLENTTEHLASMHSVHQSLAGAMSALKNRIRSTGDDAALLLSALGEVEHQASLASERFTEHLEGFKDYIHRNSRLAESLYQESIASRMRPFGEAVEAYPRMVRDISKSIGKKARFELKGKETEVDRDVLEKLDAPISHILRNAIGHGLETPADRRAAGKPETGTVAIVARHHAGMLRIEIQDDGRGIDIDRLKNKILEKGLTTQEILSGLSQVELLEFLFLPAFSTADKVTELSGRGVGLDVVQSMMQELGGTVRIETTAGAGTVFQLSLPITRSVIRALLLEIAGELYALPIPRIVQVCVVPASQIRTVENRRYTTIDDNEVGLVSAQHVLEWTDAPPNAKSLPTVVLHHHSNLYGLIVDRIRGETELVVRPLDSRLGRVPNINATAIHADGSPILILDVDDLVHSIDNKISGERWRISVGMTADASEEAAKTQRILVVDDSITVRQLQKQILESNGYEVHLAVDGVEGWNAIRLGNYDLIISDIDMPRMTGFELLEHIRGESKLANLPVIIVSYKDRESDRRRGLDLGANYYLTKSSFKNETYMNAILDLIGEANAANA